jgi:endonuclease YncB( thermonuclease family)
MIKKIMVLMVFLLSITLLVGCNGSESNEIILPNLDGMNKTEALNQLSGLGLQITFDDVVDNTKPEGTFAYYENDLEAGSVVEKNQAITIFFYSHVIIDGEVLPDLVGLDEDDVLDVLMDLDIFYTFVEYPTNDIEEGIFVQYGSNYQAGSVVPFWTNVTVYFAVAIYNDGLIISKYVEGSNDNKAIEIANLSNETVDLSEYTLSLYLNGSETISTSITLEGTLEPDELLILAHPNSDAEILAVADVLTSDLTFDGNDVVAITFRNGATVDIIGTIGFTFFYLDNETFVRKPSIITNSNEYNLLDWDIYANDNFSMLGSHPVAFPTSFTLTPEHLALPFETPMGVIEVTFISNNDGDTAEFNPGFTGGSRVRFIGIDTPEMTAPVQPWAPQATEHLYQLLSNAETIYLQHDPASGTQETYGRTLALVWADGVLTNYEMVRMGYSANMYSDAMERLVFNGVSLSRWFQRAEQEAKANNRGIWS